MTLPRVQAFEFNDSAWAPPLLRDSLVESLSRAVRWTGMMDGLVAPLARCLDASGASHVLDLCAGAGGPASVLSEAMALRGHDVHFLMSDLYPALAEWKALSAAAPQRLGYIEESVDATARLPAEGAGRVRVIINALHHFPPDMARRVLRNICQDAPGVFIAEGLVRSPWSLAAMAPVGVASMFATPLFARNRRLGRALLTWLTPIALGAAIWDGTVSALRMYLPDELHDMVAELDGWTWTFGEYSYWGGAGTGSWFSGVAPPKQR